ncbi:MAG: carboxylating nicotinate-nucleotide diphosphorylase [Pirellulales bacterium]|nr:carboxylating nicotinate-nucleotide diphosphorylase [Pirellulales bacterium]
MRRARRDRRRSGGQSSHPPRAAVLTPARRPRSGRPRNAPGARAAGQSRSNRCRGARGRFATAAARPGPGLRALRPCAGRAAAKTPWALGAFRYPLPIDPQHCHLGRYTERTRRRAGPAPAYRPDLDQAIPVAKDFTPVCWDQQLADSWQALLQLAVREDLARLYDWTSAALVDVETEARAAIVARKAGILAGLPAAIMTLAEYSRSAQFAALVADGAAVQAGQTVAVVSGSARALLAAERVMLNILGHLSGIATLTRRYVDAVAGTGARVYDTRKTTPGYRRLEKYAVRLGGGHNHRTGLFDHLLIKDNHLAVAESQAGGSLTPRQAVVRAQEFMAQMLPEGQRAVIIEIEVDHLTQLIDVLPAGPDIVLLDNMTPDELREAVAIRNRLAPHVELEASGGVRLETVAAIAATGVERISVGALTHSAQWFDVGLDWNPAALAETPGN